MADMLMTEPSRWLRLKTLSTDLDALAPPSGQFIDLPGVRCHYRTMGNPSNPPIILIHGMLATGLINWVRFIEPLARHFYVVVPDMRGCGRSRADNQHFSLEECADDVYHLIVALGLEKPIIAGYSMGGAITQYVCRRHPDSVGAMMLAATGYRNVINPYVQRAFSPALYRLSHIVAWYKQIWRFWPASKKKLPRGSTQARMWRDVKRTCSVTQLQAASAMAKHDAVDWIHTLRKPAVVVATLKDEIFTEAHQRNMAQALPHATLKEYEGGHIACLDDSYVALFVKEALTLKKALL